MCDANSSRASCTPLLPPPTIITSPAGICFGYRYWLLCITTPGAIRSDAHSGIRGCAAAPVAQITLRVCTSPAVVDSSRVDPFPRCSTPVARMPQTVRTPSPASTKVR